MRHNLINARKDSGLTQAQLGKMVGLSAQSICDIEKGRTRGTADIWEAIAAVFPRIPRTSLWRQEGHKSPAKKER